MRKTRDPKSKDRIVEAAWRTIAQEGLRGATVRAIAAAADVSTGYVMHYFADKQLLAAEVLAHNNARAGRRVLKARERTRGIDAVTAIMEALLPLDAERRLEWQVWVAFWREGDGEGLGQARGGLTDVIVGSLRQAVDDGELPAGLDLRYEAQRLVTLAAGLGLLAGITPARTVRATAERMLADHLRALRVAARPA
jgi:AcrR family transcriptional regulator